MERVMSRPFELQAKSMTAQSDGSPVALSPVRRRVRRLQWLISIGLFVFVLIYEFGISQWIESRFGPGYHIAIDIAIYGIAGPVSAYLVLHFFSRWLEERETSELQARLLMQAHERAQASTNLSDDALQTLFAASVLISSLKSSTADLSPETKIDLARTEEALNRAIQQIRDHLES
jgi:signal transduction histidine kinase